MFRVVGLVLLAAFTATAQSGSAAHVAHVWEKQEITLKAQRSLENPYQSVDVWVDLAGPGFRKRVYGFWDGENTFRVPSTLSSLFPPSPGPGKAMNEGIDSPGFAQRIDSFCVQHPELKSLVLKELLVGQDETGGPAFITTNSRLAFQWRAIPAMTEFERNSFILQRTRELLYNPSLATIGVPQADIIGLIQWLLALLK